MSAAPRVALETRFTTMYLDRMTRTQLYLDDATHARSHGVEIADALVAAAAATTGLQLWTLNRKHYPRRDVRFVDV